MRQRAALLSFVLGSGIALCQESAGPRFEVASVRHVGGELSNQSTLSGGPGTSDPTHIVYRGQPLVRFLNAAYGLEFDQITGPDWLGTDLYDVRANVPAGASKDDVKSMWQKLLADRFQLKVHVITRDFPAYELSRDSGNLKLIKSGKEPLPIRPGFPALSTGRNWGLAVQPRIRLTFRGTTMAEFVKVIGWPLSTLGNAGGMTVGRVVDKTGLPDRYDFDVEFAGRWGPGGATLPTSAQDAEPASDLFGALRSQLGLRLEEKKLPLEVLVVDHAEKSPAEN